MAAVSALERLEAPRVQWTPVLEGAEAEQALVVVGEILREADVETDPSICRGSSGLALLHGYAARAGVTANGVDRTAEVMNRAGSALANWPGTPWFADGFTGVAWVAAHLERERMIPMRRGRYGEIDAALERLLSEPSVAKHFELLYGVAGVGVYALERLPDPNARRLLGLVLDRLEESAERTRDGIAWRTPDGCVNLGVSHGMPGVIGFLGAVSAAGIEQTRAQALLTPAVSWLLSQRLRGESPAWFANEIGRDASPRPARAAWCYGDMGIAAALSLAPRASWSNDTLAIARHAARRPAEDCLVVDACFCHGAAGLGHLFNRMYQETGEPELKYAARFWLLRAMRMRAEAEGVAGYRSLRYDDNGAAWEADAGFLTGAAGVALALLAGAVEVAPSWDRALLISCRRA
jgi:hypothetical protein